MDQLKRNLDLIIIGYIILSSTIGAIHTQEHVPEVQNPTQSIHSVIGVHKCPASKLNNGHKLTVPSFAFDQQKVTLRVNDEAFPGCDRYGVQLESTQLWWINAHELTEMDIYEIEMNETSISPIGVLNVKDHFYFPDEYCLQSETRDGENPIITFQYCPVNCSSPLSKPEIERPCIKKCCPIGKSIEVNISETDVDILGCSVTYEATWRGFFYDKNTWKRISDSEMIDHKVKPHFYRKVLNCMENMSQFFWYRRNLIPSVNDRQLTKLLTDGRIVYLSPQRRWEPLADEVNFCIDGFQDSENDMFYIGNENDQVMSICEASAPQKITVISRLYMLCLFGGSAFYLLTAIVYGLLWDKLGTYGWTVFSLVTSLFFMFVFLGNAHRLGLEGNHELRRSNLCIANAILAHFFMLASFTWLTIISFDVWCTLSELKIRNVKSLTQFFFYCILGVGLPSTVVIVGITLENLYPDRESLVQIPEYGEDVCFVARWAQGVYIYYIIACLLAINVILTIMTFSKLYGFQRKTSGVRITDYLKLLVILGTSWTFEYISWQVSDQDNQHWFWTVIDFYNFFTAVFIFIIFVCKATIMNQLEEKYPRLMTPLMNALRGIKFLKLENSKEPDPCADTELCTTPGD